ncbi:MAG: MG2 domain-containing protein [Planctomycetota bacterium]
MADRDYPLAERLLSGFIAKYQVGEMVEEAHVLLMRASMGVGDHEAALEAGRRLLTSYDDSPWERKARFLMGEAYARVRGYKDAARIYREQVDFLAGDAHERKVAGYYLELADKAYEGEERPDEFGRPKRVKDFRRALTYFVKARGIHAEGDEAATVSMKIAMCHYELKRYPAAVAEWKVLLEKWSDSEWADDATYHLGHSLHLMGKDVEARKHLREVRAKHGDSEWAPHALIVLGRTHHPKRTKDEGELAKGLAYWKEYRRLHPSHEKAEEIGFSIGDAEYRFGRFDAAIEELQTFLEAFPDAESSPAAQDRIARCHYFKRDFDRAIEEWKAFLGRWPNHELWTKVQGMIAQTAYEKGHHPFTAAQKAEEKKVPELLERAEQGFRSFLAAYPVDERAAPAQYLLGEIRHKRKEFAEAISEWRIAASKYTGTSWAPASLLRIAATYEKDLNDLGKAIEGYEDLAARYARSREAGTARALLGQFRKKLLEVLTERAYATDEKCVIKVRTRNIEALRLRAYRVNLEETFRRKLSLTDIEKVAVPVVRPEWEDLVGTADYERYRLFERDLELPFNGPGAWIVTCQEDDLTATTLVVISDLTIVTKQSPRQTLVFALNERTGEPYPGVRVVLAAGGKIVAEGRTRADGVYVREGSIGRNVKVFAEASGSVADTGLSASGGASFGYSTKVYLYTDRPLYRPGHEVEIKGIHRHVYRGAYVTPTDALLDVEVRDPRDTVIFKEEVRTNEYGTFSRKVYLPPSAATGSYKILAVTKGKKSFQGGFAVREFKKPEFTITARTDRRSYLPGEDVKVKVALRYFFGGPVPETRVRYQIAKGPYAFDPSVHDEFAWFTVDPARERERQRRRAQGYAPVTEGELTTDADGNAELAFTLEDLDADARYVVVLEALDLNRQWVRESAFVTVTRQGFYVLAKTEKKVYRPKEEIALRVTAVDAVHFPVVLEGEAVVARYSIVDGREVESVVWRAKAKTGEDGRAEVEVSVAEPGEYRLKFEGEDRRGNRVVGATPVTISGETEDLARHAKVVASRQIYREGEVAEVLVNSPVAPAWSLLTFEGERVLDYKVVRLTERSTTLRLLMKPDYSPNVFVKVAIPKDRDLHQAGDEIYVFKYLEVAVTPDRAEAKPGEKVAFTVSTTDQRGKPVAAELSLALVDRSVLALEPDRAPQIKPFFYDQRRKLSVKTGCSYSFKYAGSTRPTNKDLLWEELRRQGREAFNRTMKYVRAGKEFIERGDFESAAIEFRKALQVSPANYEARALLDRVQAGLELRRHAERLQAESKSRKGFAPGEDAAFDKKADAPARRPSTGGAGGGYRGPAGEEPPAEPAPAGKFKEESEKEARFADDMDEIAAPEGDKLKDQLRRLGSSLKRLEERDVRGRAENVFDFDVEVPSGGFGFDEPAMLVPPALRKRFADTAAWEPHVVTDAAGMARVEVELPDNLTTWRAVARGVTKGTLVGETTSEVVARKDLLVRVDTPRFLTQKDSVTITSTVHNNLGEAVEIHVSLEGENVALDDPTRATQTIRPSEIRSFDFGLGATEQGLATLTAEAKTTVESDAARTGLPVIPHGLRTLVGRSGEITEEVLETASLPDGIIPGTKRLVITLSPGIDGSIIESLAYLGGYPYGCLEQTVNRFLPAIAADQALREIGSPNARLRDRLGKAVEQGLLALYSFQNDDGSFGWFRGDRLPRPASAKAIPQKGDPVMTALAILGMERARLAGYRVSARHRTLALKAGQNLVKGARSHAEKAFLLWALSRGGAASLEDLNQVYRYRDGMGSHALATLALAMAETKRNYNAVALVRILKTQAVTEGGLTHWEGEGRHHGVRNSVETTAYALRALLAVEPDSDLAEGASRWLLRQKRGPRWRSTWDTGAAVLALGDWLIAKGVARNDYVIEVWLNDGETPYQKVRVVGGQVAEDQKRTILVDGARLRTGENRVKLVKRGPGRAFYTMLLDYHVAAEKIDAAGNLVQVGRRYAEYVSPVAAKEGREEIRPGFTIVRPEARPKEARGATIDRAGSGDKFRVRLTLTARERLPYVIVEDPLPAGVEVVEGQSTGPFDWEERRDERQVFFLTEVPKGKVEISYLVQAIHPGRFHALPTMAYPMYEPEIWGRSAESLLTIVPESGVVSRPATPEGVTPDEIYALAVRDFKEERHERARAALEGLLEDFRLLDNYQEECQAMLLRINFELGDARRAVTAYERLRELSPRRGPKSTDERRKLGNAYQEIGEHERALALFRGVTGEYFGRELAVADTYREIGNPYQAQSFTERLLREYPDANDVVDRAYRTALRYLELKVPAEAKERPKAPGVDTGLMLPEGLHAFRVFLSHYPATAFADEASRMCVTVLNRMERFEDAVTEAQKFIRRYQDSVHLDDVYWYLTESYFNQGDYDRAMKTGKVILDRRFRNKAGSKKLVTSPFVPHVRYLFAKIHHLRGDLSKAVALYKKVAGRFEDARDALAFLTREELRLPETAVFGVGEAAALTIERKNLESLDLRIYPVDLMLLIAVKKDLRAANEIDLTGIATKHRLAPVFEGGKDYRWHEERIPLDIAEKGVYLVVAKAGSMVESSIILVSDLTVSVQVVGDRVRVYASHRGTREPAADVFVKISDGKEIRAQGFTDARGVFEGRKIKGSVMVVAEKDGHFALFRR